MTFVAATAMLLLLAISYRLFRSFFSPAVIYCAAWSGALMGAALLGSVLYGVSAKAALVYLLAAGVFVVGCLAGQGYRRLPAPGAVPTRWRGRQAILLLDALLLVMVLAIPAVVGGIVKAGGAVEIIMELRQTRAQTVDASGETGGFGLLKNVSVLAQFVFMMLIYRSKGTVLDRARIGLCALVWLAAGLSTGSKLVVLQLPFIAVACVAVGRRKVPWRMLGAATLAFATLFLASLYFINFGYLLRYGQTVPFTQLLLTMASYVFGGVVGYSEMLNISLGFAYTQSPLRTPMYIVNAVAVLFGIAPPFEIGTQHAPFLAVGDALDGNVYSALYAYSGAGGVFGIFAWSLVAGLSCGWVYRAVAQGRGWAFFVYPAVVYACAMSIYNEALFSGMLLLMKLLILLLLFEFALGIWSVRKPSWS